MSNYKLPKELTAAMWVAKKKMAKRVAEYIQRSREASSAKSSILYNLRMDYQQGRISMESYQERYNSLVNSIAGSQKWDLAE